MTAGVVLIASLALLGGLGDCSAWLSVPEAPVFDGIVGDDSRAADGTSWFASVRTNAADVASAKWTVTGLGVFDVYVNGIRVGDDFLKPGYTHYAKTKYSFAYDVTDLMRRKAGEVNVLAAEVSAGWWRDKIVTPVGLRGFRGRKSAFRGELEVTFADGTSRTFGTDPADWRCGIGGPVTHAAIFDGEEYDARIPAPRLGEGLGSAPEVNGEFAGEIRPSAGAEVTLRRDLAMRRGPFAVKKGETLVVDFGQNCAAVPEFSFRAGRGTVLTALPGEMLNDAGPGERGCDGPKGSVYRANLRIPERCMRLVYTFAGCGRETYLPRFTYFGYRYLSITATDDVEIESVVSVPVTSIAKELETGTLEVGEQTLGRFIRNAYWGQLSNYLSVPTDCPQRDERLGWAADTQIFSEAGAFNADTSRFFRKWMRDMRDGIASSGSFPAAAPAAQYGMRYMRIGYGDAGVIVPYVVWKQFGDTEIVRENWAAMVRFTDYVARTRYAHAAIGEEAAGRQYADWLSFENYETCSGRGVYSAGAPRTPSAEAVRYWDFLGGCYWIHDAQLMAAMARGLGDAAAQAKYAAMADEARAYVRERFVDAKDGLLTGLLRPLQTPAVFALKFGLLADPRAVEATKTGLRRNIAGRGGCLATGLLGTSMLMDTLSENGMTDVAYGLLLNRKCPSWLYSVDQGATTVWERWNSYTKKDGFGPVSMNSFNHYAYGSVLAWIWKHVAGIAADPAHPGFANIVMAPKPDRRIGFVKAAYKSASGLVRSFWRYEGDTWIWEFTVPSGATADVTLPGEETPVKHGSGSYRIERKLGSALRDADGSLYSSK